MISEDALGIVVIPCLNEEETLSRTCASLGFPGANDADNVQLVLVDNGSTDRTHRVCQEIQRSSELSVSVLTVAETGHVPARRVGNLAALKICEKEGIPPSKCVVIQADADTAYSPNYVRNCLRGAQDGHLSQALATESVALQSCPATRALIDGIDSLIEGRFGRPGLDVLVDDKLCLYTLDNYLQWGAHRREHFSDGQEQLAETSRLLMSGLSLGAKLSIIETAQGSHSPRRLLRDAAELVASGGYPYSGRRLVGITPVSLERLEAELLADSSIARKVTVLRIRHLVALTVLLPAYLERTLTPSAPVQESLRPLFRDLPGRTLHELRVSPGRLVEDVLQLVWQGSRTLARFVAPISDLWRGDL